MTAMITAAVVGTVGGAVISGRASDRAADASTAGTEMTVAEQRRQYDLTRSDFSPYRRAGAAAINNLQDPNAFKADPGYQWRVSEGARNAENAFSNRSGGGNAMRALEEFRQNMASNEYGNWWNRNLGIAQIGSGATGQVAQAGANSANAIGSAYMNNANTQGSIGLWNAANQNNMLQGGLSNALYAYQNRRADTQPIGRGN